jgi:hypothetical protein
MLRRVISISLIVLGIFILISVPRFTGFAVSENSFLKIGFQIVGLVFLIGGVALIAREKHKKNNDLEEITTDSDVHNLAHNAANYEKLKERYRFIDSHGSVPEDENAYVVRYHAFPRGKSDFSRGLSKEKAPQGFYMAETRQDAVETVERMQAIDTRDIDVVKIRISKNVYDATILGRRGKNSGIVRIGGTIYNMDNAEVIPPEKYDKANRLIQKKLIRIDRI